MENPSRYSRGLHSNSTPSSKQRSGYEPSDTETDWQESPWHDHNPKIEAAVDPQIVSAYSPRNTSPVKLSQRTSSNNGGSSAAKRDSRANSAPRRHSSKSPYKFRRDDDVSHWPKPSLDIRRNISPFSKSERRRHVSPHKPEREEQELVTNVVYDEIVGLNRKQNRRTPTRDGKGTNSQFHGVGRVTEKSTYIRRSVTAPRLRTREDQQYSNGGRMEQMGERTSSPSRNMIWKQREASLQVKAPSVGELNEMVADAKVSKGGPAFHASNFESTDSISPGDIFFSREQMTLAMQKNDLGKKSGIDSHPRPPISSVSHPRDKVISIRDRNKQRSLTKSGSSQTNVTLSSAASRHSGKLSSESSKISTDTSGRTSVSLGKFTANRRKNQTDAWFACMRKGPCRTSRSPEKQAINEAYFIEKAFVVEKLRPFWADKHQPSSLDGFTCHKQEAQLLKQLVPERSRPHILFKGPSGSGKRALAMALLREIYGDPSWDISHELRCFPVQEKRPVQVVVPLASSAHHVELNVKLEANAKYALMGLVKELSSNCVISPEISEANLKSDYKVIVLYEIDKAAEDIQHLIKWIMDRYMEVCKLMLCCEDDAEILESVKNRCKVINVDAPITHEIMEVLLQIAKKEDFDLPMSFAAKIAAKSKQNLRKAIMALEACRAHNYPFADDQPILLGWEEVLIEVAAEILFDPSPNRLFSVRGKFQKLLLEFVHPKLILQKLVEQFLKGVEPGIKREIYYWHAYYDKRLPTGPTALLKLEEFVAKFMSIYRKSSSHRRFI